MRIISKFKDYYDVVAGQGVDLTRVFTRNTEEHNGNFPLEGWAEKIRWSSQPDGDFPQVRERIHREANGRYGTETHLAEYIYVLFAGKLYGGMALKDLQFGNIGKITYYWDQESWDEKAEEIGLASQKSYFSRSYHSKGWKTDKERIEKILSIKGDEALSTWAIDNNISIAVACGFFETRERGHWFVVDANLKEINFQKVLDPFTAYQELEMWVNGVLGQNPEPLEVSDSVKIQQHGFDKWSFRKHKDDNK